MNYGSVCGASSIQPKAAKKRKAEKSPDGKILGARTRTGKTTGVLHLPTMPLVDGELRRLELETREFHRQTLPPDRHEDAAALRSFALQYNEWSVLAVARWAWEARHSAGKGNETEAGEDQGRPGADSEPFRRRRRRLRLVLPTSPTHFRRCGACGTYGHFEVMCSAIGGLSQDTVAADVDLRDEIVRGIARIDPVVERNEVCEGYAVEQCNKPFVVADEWRHLCSGTRREGGVGGRRTKTARAPPLPSRGVVMTELDHLAVYAAPNLDLLLG
jgi:hypothetical protein